MIRSVAATLPAQLSTREGATAIVSAKETSVWPERWLTLLCLTLLGYALSGRGFAYVGIPPLFIGEAVLCCGLVAFVLFGQWQGMFGVPALWLLLLLVVWGAVRTAPDVSRYGVEALRDAVIWGYSAYAVIVCGLILAKPSRLAMLLRMFDRFSNVFLLSMPVIWIAVRMFPSVPRWPWADVPVLFPKGGDVLVHCGGILAFWVAGFAGPIGMGRVLLMASLVALIGTFDRAGLLSFLTAYGLCFLVYPRDRTLWLLIVMGVCGLILLVASGIRVQMPGREREFSAAQLAANFASLTGVSRTGDLDATKEWRLEWWRDILDYTVGGKYCWTGKGFGINLADDDGYQVEEDGSLRNPHNAHLTMLARGGLPGFLLWVFVQLSWMCHVFTCYLQSRKAGHERWANLFLFLLAYFLAFMMNSTFDVFLEGPMGGIWFWTLYGVGLAAIWLYRHDPSNLERSIVSAMAPSPAAGAFP